MARQFLAERLLGHAVVRILGVHVELMRRVQAPDFPHIGERFASDFEVPRIAVLVLNDDLGHRGIGAAGSALRLALPLASRVGLALPPGAHRFGVLTFEPQRLACLMAFHRLSQLAERARFDTFEQFRHRGLADAEIGRNLML